VMTAWPIRIDPTRSAQVRVGCGDRGGVDGMVTFFPRAVLTASIVRTIRRRRAVAPGTASVS